MKSKLVIGLDDTRVLQNEWEETCGIEAIRALITHWSDLNAVIFFKQIPKLERGMSLRLKRLGFTGTIDKFVLRLTLVTLDRIVVSDDSDFWDPNRPSRRGNPATPVARFIKEEMDVTVLLLRGLLNLLREK